MTWCLELTEPAWDLKPFARACGYDGPPFRWVEERRFLLSAELDATCFRGLLQHPTQSHGARSFAADPQAGSQSGSQIVTGQD